MHAHQSSASDGAVLLVIALALFKGIAERLELQKFKESLYACQYLAQNLNDLLVVHSSDYKN